MVNMEEIQKKFKVVESEVGKIIVGQNEVVEQVIVALLCNGHVYLEGYPGLAKTLLVKSLSQVLDLDFNRIQGTPDLLPSDITGTYVIDESRGKKEFKFQKGPIFSNIVLADEVNRATPKCLSGDTSIALGDGRIMTMEDIFKNYNGRAHISVGKDEEFIIPKENFLVPSFNPKNFKIELRPVRYLYKQKTNAPLYEVELKSGRKIKTSPVHPFFTLNNKNVENIRVDLLKNGTNILVPRYIPHSNKWNQLLFSREKLKESNNIKNEIKRRKRLYQKVVNLKENYTPMQISRLLKINTDLDKNLIIGFYRTKPKYLGFEISKDSFFVSSSNNFSGMKHIKIPRKMNIKLAHFFGLLISEGYHNGKAISIDMKDKKLVKYFQLLLWDLFEYDKKIYITPKKDQTRIVINCRALNSIFNLMGYNLKTLSGTKDIPEFILKSDNKIIKEFLRMYYEGDGTVKKGSVSVTSKSLDVINKIAYMLLRFGIIGRIKKETRSFNNKIENYYVLAIYGTFVKEFNKKIGFFGKIKSNKLTELSSKVTNKFSDAIPDMSPLLRKIRKELNIKHSDFYKITGRQAHNLENPKNRTKHSRNILLDIFSKLSAKNYDLSNFNLSFIHGDFYVDFVKNVKVIKPKEDYYLYDFTIDETHSFIAGNGGIIAHNTHSAILEAMQEKQVTVGGVTYKLDLPFFVLATANPIEVEGTFVLSTAQTDRFLLKINVGYPELKEELEIVDRFSDQVPEDIKLRKVFSRDELTKLQYLVRQVPVANDIKKYAVELVASTRSEKKLIEYGASPRASLALIMASKARALMNGRKYVSMEDIKVMAFPVLRHRIILNFEAQRQNLSEDDVIKQLIKK